MKDDKPKSLNDIINLTLDVHIPFTKEEMLKALDELEKSQREYVESERVIYCGHERMAIFQAEKKRLKEIRPNHKFSDEAIFYGLTKDIL